MTIGVGMFPNALKILPNEETEKLIWAVLRRKIGLAEMGISH